MFLLCLCAYMIPSTYAQVTTISYKGAPLTPGSCNVFNTSTLATIGGHIHRPVAGGAYYNVLGGIELRTSWNIATTSQYGTAYAIEYPLLAGHSYSITITAASNGPAGTSPVPMYANFYSTLPDPNLTNPAACGPVANSNYSVVQSAYSLNVPPGSAQLPYGFPPYTPGTNKNGFTILAAPALGTTGIVQVTITKVTIAETIAFNMIPTTINKVCGTALYQPVGVKEIVSGAVYNFILGANNGYTYNGSPAPAIISTPSSAIALTADACSPPLTAVTANVNVGGTIYPVNGTVTVVNTPPAIAISGPTTSVCTSSTYTVNTPCGSTVAWSTSNISGFASIAPSGSSVVVTRLGKGPVTLTATVSGGCLSTAVTAIKTVNVGPPPNPVLTNISLAPYPYYGVFASCTANSAGPFYWYVDGALKKTTSGDIADVIPVGNCGVQHRLQVKIVNDCGEAWSDPFYWTNTCGARMASADKPDSVLRSQSEAESDNTIDVLLAPNPSSNNVTVSINPGKTKSTPSFVKAIRILDISGKAHKTLNYPNSNQSKVTVDVSELKPGIYLINVSDGRNNYIKKLVIQ